MHIAPILHGRVCRLESSEKTIAILGDRWWSQTVKQGGDRISKQCLCNTWKKRNERPNVGGISIRSRNGARSRKGYVVNGQQATNQYTPPPPLPTADCIPPYLYNFHATLPLSLPSSVCLSSPQYKIPSLSISTYTSPSPPHANPVNYREITLLSTVGKTCCTILNDRMGTMLEKDEKK